MLVNKHILMNEAAADGAASGTAAPAPIAAQAVTTTVQSAPADQTATQAKAAWPDNWRDMFSKGDEKRANIASRFASPEAAFDAFIQANDKIRSGNLKEIKPFPDKGTPEEQVAWRKENGLPESHDKYNLDGVVIGEEDKPFVEQFMKSALEANMNDKQVSKALDWYFKSREAQVEQQEQADRQTASEVQEKLRQEWGQEFGTNKTRIESLLNTAPNGVKDKLLNARYSDGTAVFNDPDVLRFLVGLQMQIDPATTLVGGSGNQIDLVGDELTKIEKYMKTNRTEYFKDQAMQEKYRKLLDAKTKLASRA